MHQEGSPHPNKLLKCHVSIDDQAQHSSYMLHVAIVSLLRRLAESLRRRLSYSLFATCELIHAHVAGSLVLSAHGLGSIRLVSLQ